MKKNDIYKVNIEAYNSEAYGVARIEGRAVFIPFVKKGEEHNIKIVKVTNSAIWGICLDNLPTVDCPYYYKCGGCNCRHMTYEEELQFKLTKVNDAFKRIGKLDFHIDTIVPSDKTSRYRNKAIYNVDHNKFGFYRERSHDIIAIDDCLLQTEFSVDCAKKISSLNLNGNINKIFIRDTVCTVVSKNSAKPIPIEGLTGFVNCINSGRENSILNGQFETLYGDADLIENLCGFKFNISPLSFFQINPIQAEKLYFIASDYAGSGDVAVELYCGAGTISMLLAQNFNHVIATEIVPEAIENAKNNAKLNNVSNVEFICKDSSEFNEKADVILVDPPRKGMSLEAINSIIRCNPKKIVYISCNPSTMARDLSLLSSYYFIKKGTVVDMFPKTKHVETVVQLVRKKPDTYLDVKIDMKDIDVTPAEAKATYDEIKNYIFEKYSVKVSSLNIAQVKEKYGNKKRENYNKSKNADVKQPQCPKYKEQMIIEALKHFKMVTE